MHSFRFVLLSGSLVFLLSGQSRETSVISRTIVGADGTYLQVDRPGYVSTFLTGIAANGRISGYASTEAAVNSAPSQYIPSTGFVLDNGRFVDLVHPNPLDQQAPMSTYPLKIQNNGTASGWSTPNAGPSSAEVGWVYERGRFVNVMYLGPDYEGLDPAIRYEKATNVMSGNERGELIGQVAWVNPADPTPAGFHWRGWLYQRGVFLLIDPPGANLTYPSDINSRGEVVGLYRTATARKGFLRAPSGGLQDIEFPAPATGPVLLTFPQAINNAGVIAGFYVLTPGVPKGFVLRDGNYQTVEVPDSLDTVVYGINDAGIMVGTFRDAYGVHGFIRMPKW